MLNLRVLGLVEPPTRPDASGLRRRGRASDGERRGPPVGPAEHPHHPHRRPEHRRALSHAEDHGLVPRRQHGLRPGLRHDPSSLPVALDDLQWPVHPQSRKHPERPSIQPRPVCDVPEVSAGRRLHDRPHGKFLTKWPNTTNPPHFDRFTITSGGYYGLYVRSNDGGYKNPAAYSTTYLTQKALEDIDVFGGRSARRPTSTSRRTTSRGTSRSASIDLVKTPGRTRTSSRMGTPRTTRTSRRSGRRSRCMRNALARSVRERGGAERGLYGPDSPNPASRSTAPGSPACPSAGSPKSFSIVQRRS